MLKYNIDELKELMRSLYTFSGIRFLLFDSERNKIYSYPEEDCEFCTLMKADENGCKRCLECDKNSFIQSEKSNSLLIYKCHAGLVEATVALRENGRIIGYLMFGQISDEKDRDKMLNSVAEYCETLNLSGKEMFISASKIPFKDSDTVLAAAKLMEACASYILLRELITPENNRIVEAVKEYTEANINRDFSIAELCSALKISRTKLYEAFRNETNTGVSAFIRETRLKKARTLLKTTDMPVWEISEAIGFSDYNYFSRVYKKHYGKAPKSYRK